VRTRLPGTLFVAPFRPSRAAPGASHFLVLPRSARFCLLTSMPCAAQTLSVSGQSNYPFEQTAKFFRTGFEEELRNLVPGPRLRIVFSRRVRRRTPNCHRWVVSDYSSLSLRGALTSIN